MKRRMTIMLVMLMTVVVSAVAHDVKAISCSHLVRDYQGSIMSQVDSTGYWHNDWSYDAWGRPRNPQTHVVYNPSILNSYSSAYRGYCGHEHLPQFGLINMNARLYDPVTSRFLSPDPYVQVPDNTQSFNRYSYCLNNPTKYTDPSTGISSGQYFMDPSDDKFYSIWQHCYNNSNNTPMIPLCTSLDTFVGYSVVTDSIPDVGSHIYCFTNFANIGYAPPTGIVPSVNNMEVGNFDAFFRLDFQRGKIAVEYIKDANHAINKSVRYEYRTDFANYSNQKCYGFDTSVYWNNLQQGGVYTLYYPKYDLQRVATSTKYGNGWVNDTITYVMADFNSPIGTLQPPYFRKCSEERTERVGEKTQKLYSYQSSTSTKYFIPLVSTISKCNNSKVITEKCLYESFGGVKHPKYETRAVGIGGQDTLITYHSYSSTGLPTSYTRDGEYPTHLFWDSQGRLLASLTCPPALASQAVLDTTAVDPIQVLRIGSQSIFNYPEVRATSYVYDAHGNISATATENGLTHYYLYDVFGRLTEIQDRQHRTLQRFDYHYSTSSQNNNPDIPTI